MVNCLYTSMLSLSKKSIVKITVLTLPHHFTFDTITYKYELKQAKVVLDHEMNMHNLHIGLYFE